MNPDESETSDSSGSSSSYETASTSASDEEQYTKNSKTSQSSKMPVNLKDSDASVVSRRLVENSSFPEIFTEYPEEVGLGLCGMENFGNTCYFNSVIQCLVHTEKLRNYALMREGLRSTARSDEHDPKALLVFQFYKLVSGMWAKTTEKGMYIVPEKLASAFAKCVHGFRINVQQDAHEFMSLFLDAAHEGLKEVQVGDTANFLTDHRRLSQPANSLGPK